MQRGAVLAMVCHGASGCSVSRRCNDILSISTWMCSLVGLK